MSSDLDGLYQEVILDHGRHPRNFHELEGATRTAEGFNPLCGDEIKVYLLVEDGKVEDIRISGQGCSISQSSASMMSQAVKGKPVEQARAIVRTFKSMMSSHGHELEGESESGDGERAEIKLGDLEALRGVVKFPVRIKCATLAWNTLTQAMDDAQ